MRRRSSLLVSTRCSPDIIWPDNYTYIPTGEKEQDHSLEWDKIEPTNYVVDNTHKSSFKKVIKASQKRIEANSLFNEIDKNAQRWKAQRDKHIFTLNLEKYQAEVEAQRKISDQYRTLFKPYEDMNILMLRADEEVINADSTKLKRAQDWHKALKKDVYLYETIQVAEQLK